ncbi:MAG: C25 family cysteine peptidase, partial [Planctomycetota bacterium]
MRRTRRFLSYLLLAVLFLTSPLSREGFTDEGTGPGWYRPPPGLDRVEYLILTGKDLVEAWEPMRDWKCREGLPADVVAVETVLDNPLYRGADAPETIRNFLKDLYWKWGLTWVLLGADVNIVPTRFIRLMERQACDIYFACLEGTWNEDGDALFGGAHDRVVQQADVYLGRVPVETPAEVHAFLTKFFKYVKPVHRDYQKRVLLVGAVLGSDYRWDADDHYEYLKTEYLKPAGFEITHLEQTDFLRGHFERDPETKKCSAYLFGPSNKKAATSFRTRVVEEINRGFNLLSHYAHSNTYAMGLPRGGLRNADVKGIANAERPTVFYSCGCHVNQFDHESISEELLLHPAGGAVAFIGCTVNSYALQNFFERDFFGALLRHGEYRIGRVHEASRTRQSASNSAGMSSLTVLNRGLSLLGDPHMPLWTDTPKDLRVEFARPGPGADALVVTVSGGDGSPLPGATAALWKKGAYIVRRETDAAGKAVLPLPKRDFLEISLTVTARNHVPLEREVPLAPAGPKLSPFDVSLEEGGDALEPGRNVVVTVAVRNDGEDAAKDVVALLTSKDAYVKTEDQRIAYPPVEPGGVALPQKGFSFAVKPDAPPHHLASFQLRIVSGTHTVWEGPIRLPVHVPRLILSAQALRRGGKPAAPPLEAGDGSASATVALRLANLGSGTARSVQIQLECPHDAVEVENGRRVLDVLA